MFSTLSLPVLNPDYGGHFEERHKLEMCCCKRQVTEPYNVCSPSHDDVLLLTRPAEGEENSDSFDIRCEYHEPEIFSWCKINLIIFFIYSEVSMPGLFLFFFIYTYKITK